MWKAALLLVLLFVAGHFAVRYLRTNPLDPVFEGRELTVLTRDHEVRFALEGEAGGTYLVAKAERRDFGDEPVNASLSVVRFSEVSDFLRAHPDRHAYGNTADLQLENLAAPLGLIAVGRVAYGDLISLVDLHADRAAKEGEWICVTIAGSELRLTAAETLGSGSDSTNLFERRAKDTQVLLVNRLQVEDCAKTASAH